MKARRRFKEYVTLTQIEESSWLSKGYAIGQSSRHASVVRQLESLLGKIENDCKSGRLGDDVGVKVNVLLDSIAGLSVALKLIAELSRANINVSVASNLLEDDLRSLIAKAINKK